MPDFSNQDEERSVLLVLKKIFETGEFPFDTGGYKYEEHISSLEEL